MLSTFKSPLMSVHIKIQLYTSCCHLIFKKNDHKKWKWWQKYFMNKFHCKMSYPEAVRFKLFIGMFMAVRPFLRPKSKRLSGRFLTPSVLLVIKNSISKRQEFIALPVTLWYWNLSRFYADHESKLNHNTKPKPETCAENCCRVIKACVHFA